MITQTQLMLHRRFQDRRQVLRLRIIFLDRRRHHNRLIFGFKSVGTLLSAVCLHDRCFISILYAPLSQIYVLEICNLNLLLLNQMLTHGAIMLPRCLDSPHFVKVFSCAWMYSLKLSFQKCRV